MGQPSTSAQVRAVALREAVASVNPLVGQVSSFVCAEREEFILARAERFANYIENGVEEDAQGN